MSGGSYDYVYSRVEEAAAEVDQRHPTSMLHRAFATHLRLVAVALHDIEWTDSGDYGAGGDVAAITAALGGNADAAVLAEVRRQLDELRAVLDQLEGRAP